MNKRNLTIGGASIAVLAASFFGGRFSVEERTTMYYDREAIELLLELGVTPDDFVRALQLQLATGKEVDIMALKQAMSMPPGMIDLVGESHLAPHVFREHEDD